MQDGDFVAVGLLDEQGERRVQLVQTALVPLYRELEGPRPERNWLHHCCLAVPPEEKLFHEGGEDFLITSGQSERLGLLILVLLLLVAASRVGASPALRLAILVAGALAVAPVFTVRTFAAVAAEPGASLRVIE